MPGVGAAVYEVLTEDAAVAAILGADVYPPGGVPGGQEPPWAEYAVNSNVADKSLGGNILGYDAEVTVSLITETYEQAQELQAAAVAALETMAGSVGGLTVDAAAVVDASDEPNGPIDRDEQQVYQADVTVGIYYRES